MKVIYKMNNTRINGYVYFIYSPELYKKGINYMKIGHTKNLDRRLSQLQTGNPFQLIIYKTYQSVDYKRIESNLHKKYSHKRVRNEWFDITIQDVDNELKILDSTQEQAWSSYIISKITNLFPISKFWK